MDQLLSNPFEWAQSHETFLWWMAGVSVTVFVVTLLVAIWAVVRMPQDYFVRPQRYRSAFLGERPALRTLARVLSNLLGVLFVIAGLLMLLLPGQGVLTILIGLLLMNFPGKNRLIRYIVSRPKILSSINSMRRRASRQPLILEDA